MANPDAGGPSTAAREMPASSPPAMAEIIGLLHSTVSTVSKLSTSMERLQQSMNNMEMRQSAGPPERQSLGPYSNKKRSRPTRRYSAGATPEWDESEPFTPGGSPRSLVEGFDEEDSPAPAALVTVTAPAAPAAPAASKAVAEKKSAAANSPAAAAAVAAATAAAVPNKVSIDEAGGAAARTANEPDAADVSDHHQAPPSKESVIAPTTTIGAVRSGELAGGTQRRSSLVVSPSTDSIKGRSDDLWSQCVNSPLVGSVKHFLGWLRPGARQASKRAERAKKRRLSGRRKSSSVEAPDALRDALSKLAGSTLSASLRMEPDDALIINPDSVLAAAIYGFVVAAVSCELIVSPYVAGFGHFEGETMWYAYTSAMYAVDLVLRFVTPDAAGGAITGATDAPFTYHTVGIKYLKSGYLALDVVACVPWYLLGPGWGLLRLVKVAHFFKPTSFWNMTESQMLASFFRVIHLLVVFCFIMHWSACTWHNSMSPEFEDIYIHHDETNWWQVYVTSTVFGLSFLLQLGAYHPTNQRERLVMVVLTLIGACFQASIFGSIAALISGLDLPASQFRQKIADMSHQMRGLGLPLDLRKRVLGYHEMNWKMSRGEDGINSFVNELSPSLYSDVKIMLYRDLVQRIPFIRKCPEISLLFVEALVLKLESCSFLPGDMIIRRGEAGDWMGFIGRDGRAAVLDPKSTVDNPTILKVLVEGDYIGEMAVFYETRRTADVQALTWLKVHKLVRADLEDVMAQYPDDAVFLSKEIRRISRRKFTSVTVGDKAQMGKNANAVAKLPAHRENGSFTGTGQAARPSITAIRDSPAALKGRATSKVAPAAPAQDKAAEQWRPVVSSRPPDSAGGAGDTATVAVAPVGGGSGGGSAAASVNDDDDDDDDEDEDDEGMTPLSSVPKFESGLPRERRSTNVYAGAGM